MRAGADFPPIVVFHDGNRYLCADGFHRTLAAARISRDTLKAEVRQGSKQDALKFALSCNCAHGIRRTTADKKRAIGLALTEWPQRNDNWIANLCGVHNQTVTARRSEMEALNNLLSPPMRETSDGRLHPAHHSQRPPNQPTQRAHVGGELYGDANGQTEQEDAPRIVTADRRQTETDPLPPLLDTLRELEASALDLRNQ